MKINSPYRALKLDKVLECVMNVSDEVILFGSRSCGLHDATSDWDILCIAPRRPQIMRYVHGHRMQAIVEEARLDLIWVNSALMRSQQWLGCELAGHVAGYGRWLHGHGDWRLMTTGSVAIAAKRERIRTRIEFKNAYGSELLPAYSVKHLTLLRRDIQRLYYLEIGAAVPSTPQLDRDWSQRRHRGSVIDLGKSYGCDLNSE
jgi:hypothetical protein